MELYTSYWASPLLPHLGATMVAISRGKPRWRLPQLVEEACEILEQALSLVILNERLNGRDD